MAAKKATLSPPSVKTPVQHNIAARLAQRTVTAANPRPLPARANGTPRLRQSATHKYRAGETVTLVPNRYGSNRHGRFEVTRLLPEEQGINHYRLKSVTDGHERVAREDELI
jgi:hypothetical protein